MKKIHFIFDKTIKSQKLKKIFFKKNKNIPVKKSKIIVVGGGDGFMLRTMKKYYKFRKPFYGINCGSIGFLMNRYNIKNFKKKIEKAKVTTIYPLQVLITNIQNKKSSFLAINELSLLRQSKQTAFLKLKVNNKFLIKKLVGDGVLISTPAGSTAYNLSVYGPILSLNSKKLAITPISPFRPRRWKGKIISDKKKIFIQNIDPKKRPISGVIDNNEIRNVKLAKVKINKKIKLKILFNSNENLLKKISLEQKKRSNIY